MHFLSISIQSKTFCSLLSPLKKSKSLIFTTSYSPTTITSGRYSLFSKREKKWDDIYGCLPAQFNVTTLMKHDRRRSSYFGPRFNYYIAILWDSVWELGSKPYSIKIHYCLKSSVSVCFYHLFSDSSFCSILSLKL